MAKIIGMKNNKYIFDDGSEIDIAEYRKGKQSRPASPQEPTRKEIIAGLEERGIEYKRSMSKAELKSLLEV